VRHDPADAVLARRGPPDEGRVFGGRSVAHFHTAWEFAVERAKLADFRWHDLRHADASWLVQKRVTLLEVKDLLGHSSLAMTTRYSNLAPEHLRQAAASLDGVLASRTPVVAEISAQGSAHALAGVSEVLQK
jgi:integrase